MQGKWRGLSSADTFDYLTGMYQTIMILRRRVGREKPSCDLVLRTDATTLSIPESNTVRLRECWRPASISPTTPKLRCGDTNRVDRSRYDGRRQCGILFWISTILSNRPHTKASALTRANFILRLYAFDQVGFLCFALSRLSVPSLPKASVIGMMLLTGVGHGIYGIRNAKLRLSVAIRKNISTHSVRGYISNRSYPNSSNP